MSDSHETRSETALAGREYGKKRNPYHYLGIGNITAATWIVKNPSTKVVDIGDFADGAIQTISRVQGGDVYESLPLLTTYDAIAKGPKHEGKLESIAHSGFATNGVSPGDRVYSYE